MNFRKLFHGKALYTEKNRIWVSRGLTFYAIDYSGKRVTQEYKVGGFKSRLLASNRLSEQLLREDIRNLMPLKDGSLFVTAKRHLYTVAADGTIRNDFTEFIGNKPGHQGVCVTPDGTLFFGEYSVNIDHKNQSRLFRSMDNGITFKPIYTFDRNIRHIHFIKYDAYEACLWLGTGDIDSECLLMRSADNGDTWTAVGSGSQDWRTIGVCFTPDSLIWGTDAGSVPNQNHIVKMERGNNKLEIIGDVEGPCHGSASFADGRVFISTGVEGGENEKDRYARLKRVDGNAIIDLLKVKKDMWPLIIQYGVMRFPLGTENTNKVVFTMMGLRGGGEMVYIGEDE